MSTEKFTQLPTVTNATLSDIICAVQSGTSVQETLSQVSQLFLANTILNFAGNPNGFLAGSIYQLCWDTTDKLLYVCTTTGTVSTAVWTQIGTPSFTWINVTGAAESMLPNTGYVADNSGLVTFTLPSVAAFGTVLRVVGQGAGGWKINTGAGQQMIIGSLSSSVGSGSVASTNQYDAVDLLCTVANTTWTSNSGPQGNLTIV